MTEPVDVVDKPTAPAAQPSAGGASFSEWFRGDAAEPARRNLSLVAVLLVLYGIGAWSRPDIFLHIHRLWSNELTVLTLASSIGVGKPSVSRQIAFLERLGLVVKEADPLDGRAQMIRLTPVGEQRMHEVQDARREVFRERLGEWPTEDLQTLSRYIAKLNATYERDGFPREEPQ